MKLNFNVHRFDKMCAAKVFAFTKTLSSKNIALDFNFFLYDKFMESKFRVINFDCFFLDCEIKKNYIRIYRRVL